MSKRADSVITGYSCAPVTGVYGMAVIAGYGLLEF